MRQIVSLVTLWLCVAPSLAVAQQPSVSLGGVWTEAEARAVKIGVKFLKDLPDVFEGTYDSSRHSGSLWDFSPSVELQTGEKGTFNGLVAKFTGHLVLFKTTEVAGLVTPDSSRLFHAFPMSFGFESDRTFNTLNAIAEVGWSPFFFANPNTRLGLNPKVGVFVQAGYKFDRDQVVGSAPSGDLGGVADLTELGDAGAEQPGEALARLKLDASGDYTLPALGKRLSLMGTATAWVDLRNSELYHSVSATLRISMSDDVHFDAFKWQNGAGAPNFNEGDEFSSNLTIEF